MKSRFLVLLAGMAFSLAPTGQGRADEPPAIPSTPPDTPFPALILPSPLPLPKESKRLTAIQLKNIRASTMAWMFDPENNDPPAFSSNPYMVSTGNALVPLSFSRPKGVDRIVAIEPQNALLVFSDETGLEELKKQLVPLDEKSRLFQVEAQFVKISPDDQKLFNVVPQQNTQNQAMGNTDAYSQIGLVEGDYHALLSTLVAKKRAKILITARNTLITNFKTVCQFSLGDGIDKTPHLMWDQGYLDWVSELWRERPELCGATASLELNNKSRPQLLFDGTPSKGEFPITLMRERQLALSSIIEDKETLALTVLPSWITTLKKWSSYDIFSSNHYPGSRYIYQRGERPALLGQEESLILDQSKLIQMTASMKVGETIVLRGLDSRFFTPLQDNTDLPSSEGLLFITLPKPEALETVGNSQALP